MFTSGEAVTVVDGKSKRKGVVVSVNARVVHVKLRDESAVFGVKSLRERGGTRALVSLGGGKQP